MKTLKPEWAVKLGLGKTGMSNVGVPVSFSTGATGIAAGSTIPLNVANLQSGYRASYWIDEIRMQVYSDYGLAIAIPAINQMGGYMMQFQFRTGSYAFSKTPIPMALYAPQYGFSGLNEVQIANSALGHSVRWPLPKPLFMGPGDQIQCAVTRLPGIMVGTNFNATVTYVGRMLPPGAAGPVSRCVPWVSNYIHDFANSYSETQDEFKNPLVLPLWIHRFVGRPGSKDTGGAADSSATGNGITGGDFGSQHNMLPTSNAIKYASVYIEDSLGYKIVAGNSNAYAPVGAVFDTERCAWTFGRPLGPRQQFNMKFQTIGTVGGTNAIFGVGMVGYREEAG